MPKVPCVGCGTLLFSGRSSAPASRRFCHPCRRLGLAPKIVRPTSACAQCAGEFVPKQRVRGVFTITCSKLCAQHLRAGRVPGDTAPGHNAARVALERSRPGLTRSQRQVLLHKWISQSRCCAYCTNVATTVDHVIPLFRGGTNFEGNLVPACLGCNISKARWLLMEWRGRGSQLRRVRHVLRSQAA